MAIHPERMAAARPRILVVEDEAALATMLHYNLEKQGFCVDEASDGEEALLRVAEAPPHLVLLDWMLPRLSGLEVCRQIRRKPDTRDLPVIMITARSQDADAVRGLNIGADDYVTKPFAIDMLIARINALLRRAAPTANRDVLTFAGLHMDPETRRVQRDGRKLQLGPTEYRLLEFFLAHPRRVFTREEVLRGVWGSDIHVEPRTVDVHIRRLRRAVNAEGEPDILRTVRSAGYALDPEPD